MVLIPFEMLLMQLRLVSHSILNYNPRIVNCQFLALKFTKTIQLDLESS